MADRLNIKIEPMVVNWGESVMQVQTITCVADVASSLNNKYFVFYDAAGVKNYVWFDVNSAGTDPAVSGGTGHEVNLGVADSASAVATATAAVLTAVTGFDCTASSNVLTLTATVAGRAKPAHDGAAPSGFDFVVDVYGDTAADVGYTDGSIELSFEQNLVDIVANQTGSEILSHINTGNNLSFSIVFKETSYNQLRKIFGDMTDSLVPDGTGVSSTEVLGYGTTRQFKQTYGRAKKLVMHPKVLASNDYSRDWCFWKAIAMPESIAFSGEEIMNIPVAFMVYIDTTKAPQISKMVIGDHTQTLT